MLQHLVMFCYFLVRNVITIHNLNGSGDINEAHTRGHYFFMLSLNLTCEVNACLRFDLNQFKLFAPL